MGGNLFSESKRLSKEKYESLAIDVVAKLNAAGREAVVPPCFKLKVDHGDQDVCISGEPLNNEDLYSIFGHDIQIHRNTNVVSILYEETQVDLNFQEEENYKTAIAYFSWNDASNLVGKIARALNYNLGHYGLAYNIRLSESDNLGKVNVSKDWSKILEFLGFDGNKWNEGFSDPQALYEWVVTSPYFDQSKFAYENLTHICRIRDRKRPVYHGFIKWLEGKEFPVLEVKKEEQIFRGIYFFGDHWIKETFILIEERRRKERIRAIFSGADLLEMGYNGKALGAVLESFKKSVPDYDNLVLSKSKEEMIELFKIYERNIGN